MDACIDCLRRRATELVRAVASAKSGTLLSPPVRRCVHYIHIHLHEKMPLSMLASEAGLSKDYLGVRFKREMGVSVHAYILQQRLQASLPMLLDGTGCRRIAYDLGFADESHYIAAAPRRSTGGFTRTDFIGQTVGTGLYFQTVKYLYCLMGDSVV